jgi:hypothetical protein
MKLEELMKTTPESLAKKQHEHLKKFVIKKIEVILDIIKQENYEEVEHFTSYSPSGDGYGLDNNFINFSYSNSEENALDIIEVVDELKYLKNIYRGDY